MKTIRLLFLLTWALAQSSPKAPAQILQCSAGVPTLPALSVSAPEVEPVETLSRLTATRISYTNQVLQMSHKATDNWRAFVDEWLINRKKMWVWMFLLLLLLARL